MPIIANSQFKRPFYLPNGHLESIYPSVFRKISDVNYERERLELADGDFLDLDWVKTGSSSLLVLTHGLEGSSDRHYIKGQARMFSQKGWDVLAWNCRTCSGEMNRAQRMYHHADTQDISTAILHALEMGKYQQIVLAGFSMGANITLNYLGKFKNQIPVEVKCAAVFSAPLNLAEGANVLDQPYNWIYKQRFLHLLKKKISVKSNQYPGVVDMSDWGRMKSWRDFDELFTAPINGFRDAEDYYQQASPIHILESIVTPVLLLQSINDSFLTASGYPEKLCREHSYIHLEMPAYGGHVGFTMAGSQHTFAEVRAWEFANEILRS